MVEHQLPKLRTRVRFPSSAPSTKAQVTGCPTRTWAFVVQRAAEARPIRGPFSPPEPARRPLSPRRRPGGRAWRRGPSAPPRSAGRPHSLPAGRSGRHACRRGPSATWGRACSPGPRREEVAGVPQVVEVQPGDTELRHRVDPTDESVKAPPAAVQAGYNGTRLTVPRPGGRSLLLTSARARDAKVADTGPGSTPGSPRWPAHPHLLRRPHLPRAASARGSLGSRCST